MSSSPSSSRLIVGPFNRVEGDLEVHLSVAQNRVTNAWVKATLFRGFERILVGKQALDVLAYAPRICGICSVSQSVAASYALANLYHTTPPHNGRLATNILLANENSADHLTSFYLFFMPDFTRQLYQEQDWYADVSHKFAQGSTAYLSKVMQARAQWLNIMGILAGKWPHSLAIRAGGTTKSLTVSEVIQLKQEVQRFTVFLETQLIGDRLANFLALSTPDHLWQWLEVQADKNADLPLFMRISRSLALSALGKRQSRLMSYGSFLTGHQQSRHFASGTYVKDSVELLNTQQITEDVSHAYYQQVAPQSPWHETLSPELGHHESAYSWCKAPRLAGEVVEVGALARQVVNANPLIRALFDQEGSNVFSRVFARVYELGLLTQLIDQWIDDIHLGEPFFIPEIPADGCGLGLVEAARGSLGHWLTVEKGKIKNFQVIAPTTWNFSPRDQQGIAGALEQALVGAPCYDGEDSADPASVQHIVRSFDPCMVCTVH